jgi:hypothetical protein
MSDLLSFCAGCNTDLTGSPCVCPDCDCYDTAVIAIMNGRRKSKLIVDTELRKLKAEINDVANRLCSYSHGLDEEKDLNLIKESEQKLRKLAK